MLIRQIKIHRSRKQKAKIQSLHLLKDPKNWENLKKEIGYPIRESAYSDLKCDYTTTKKTKIG